MFKKILILILPSVLALASALLMLSACLVPALVYMNQLQFSAQNYLYIHCLSPTS